MRCIKETEFSVPRNGFEEEGIEDDSRALRLEQLEGSRSSPRQERGNLRRVRFFYFNILSLGAVLPLKPRISTNTPFSDI